jgi:hypothetical protein
MERSRSCFFCGVEFKCGSMGMWIMHAEEDTSSVGMAIYPCDDCAFFYTIINEIKW